MNVGTRQWAGRVVGCEVALRSLQQTARRGKPIEMIESARKLQEESTALVAWLIVAIESEEDEERRPGARGNE